MSIEDHELFSAEHYLKKELYDRMKSDNEIFEFLQQGSLDGIWYWDLENQDQEWMSPRFWETLGFDPSEKNHSPKEWQALIFEEDLALVLENFHKHYEDPHHAYDQIVRYRHKLGNTLWIRCRGLIIRNHEGKPLRMLGAHTDITSQILVMEKLKDSELKFRTLAENSVDYILTVNRQLEITYLNKSIFNIERESYYGKSILSLVAEIDYQSAITSINSVFKSGEIIKFETICRANSNNPICYEVTASPVLDHGVIKEVLLLVVDISERKRVASEIILEKEKAEEANRAKSRFLANMSHEIRTPLNGIMGSLQLLRLEDNLNDEQSSLLDIAQSSSEKLIKVINDILDYSKIEAGKVTLEKVSFNLKTILNDVKNLFIASIKQKDLNFQIHIHENVPPCLVGDPFRLHQIISNIVGNAVKFTPSGHIKLSAHIESQKEDALLLCITVEDTGIGISPEALNSIFESFNQVDTSTTRQFGGTGLGLAITKSLVEQMGGSIKVSSEIAIGTVFNVICAIESNHEEIKQDCSETFILEHLDQEKIQILIVEDDPISQILMEKLSHKKGWDTTIAHNGQMAVELVQKQHFDAIVMDIQMPILDGYSATLEIRKMEALENLHTPIIAMTAFALKGAKGKCEACGMDDFLTKPVNAEDFYERMEHLIYNKGLKMEF